MNLPAAVMMTVVTEMTRLTLLTRLLASIPSIPSPTHHKRSRNPRRVHRSRSQSRRLGRSTLSASRVAATAWAKSGKTSRRFCAC